MELVALRLAAETCKKFRKGAGSCRPQDKSRNGQISGLEEKVEDLKTAPGRREEGKRTQRAVQADLRTEAVVDMRSRSSL